MTDRINIVHVLLLSVLAAGCSIAFQKGGILHPECAAFLQHYLSDNHLLNKIYDSNVVDIGCFQARDLSFFFDYIDCKFIALSISLGYPHFYSFTHYLFAISIGLIIWRFSVKELALKPLMGAGIVMLFWTSPSVFLCNYFRSSKIGAALAVTVLFYWICSILRKDLRSNEYRLAPAAWPACFSAIWCATLFDTQGLFLAGVFFAFILLWFSAFPSKNIFKLLLAFCAGITLCLLYKYQISPSVTFLLNHYRPDAWYLQIPVEQFIAQYRYWICNGAYLLADTARFLIGNISYRTELIAGFMMFLSLAFTCARLMAERKKLKLFSVVVAGFVMCYTLICLMLAIMASKHPAILWPDVRRVYYWLPIVSVLCMTIAFILSQFTSTRLTRRWLVYACMIIAIAGNIYAIPRHRAVLISGHLKGSYESAPGLLAALKNIRDSSYRPLPEAEQNPVYRHFKRSLCGGKQK